MSGKFTVDLTRIINKAKGRIDTVVQKVTYDLFKAVILKSPVDTGRFRANWAASVNSYGSVILDVEDKDGSETVNKMAGVVLNTPAGNVVYMVNNLPYAIPLEYGHSKIQAPHGMVRLSIEEFQNYLNKSVSEL